MNNSTGMIAGQRYSIEHVSGSQEFQGFFLDGKYFLQPELLTAIGWLEGDRFIYDQVNAAGEFVFADGLAGTINDLTFTMVDGTSRTLTELDVSAPLDEAPERSEASASDDTVKRKVANPAFLFATAATTVLIGYLVGRLSESRAGGGRKERMRK